MSMLMQAVELLNFQLPGGRWQSFEWCDLWITPSVLKHCCQDTLTAQWTKRMPYLQDKAPAELAASLILEALDDIDDLETSQYTVIDFCSGAGGPVALMEKLVNQRRKDSGRKPIQFKLSDIHPNLDAWMDHASRSANLSFVPQSVDATNPPFAVISTTTPGDKEAAFEQGFSSSNKVFRLFCLSFHHFNDDAARKTLKSTLETSSAFAIIELQDRNIGTLLLMLLEYLLLILFTVFWFPHDEIHLFFTYLVPVLPAIQTFDGLISCLRTRTFEEIIQLVEQVQGSGKSDHALKGDSVVAGRGDWVFMSSRAMHTWPLGYMNAIVGRKIDRESKSLEVRL